MWVIPSGALVNDLRVVWKVFLGVSSKPFFFWRRISLLLQLLSVLCILMSSCRESFILINSQSGKGWSMWSIISQICKTLAVKARLVTEHRWLEPSAGKSVFVSLSLYLPCLKAFLYSPEAQSRCYQNITDCFQQLFWHLILQFGLRFNLGGTQT